MERTDIIKRIEEKVWDELAKIAGRPDGEYQNWTGVVPMLELIEQCDQWLGTDALCDILSACPCDQKNCEDCANP